MKRPNDRLNDILIVVGILVAFMAGVKIYVLDPNPQIMGDFLSRFQRATEAPTGPDGTTPAVTPTGLTPIPSDTLSASATPYVYVSPAATFTGIAPSTPIFFTLMPPPTFVAIGTLTPTPTNNPNATHTHTPTSTPTATITPTATNTRTPSPTWTDTPVDTPTDTPTDTTAPPTATPTDTPVPPTATPTDTPVPPDTPTPTP